MSQRPEKVKKNSCGIIVPYVFISAAECWNAGLIRCWRLCMREIAQRMLLIHCGLSRF